LNTLADAGIDMPPTALAARRRLRVAFILMCVAGSLIGGLGLVWLFAPRAFRPLETLDLLVILGILILPAITGWAMLRESREGRINVGGGGVGGVGSGVPGPEAACAVSKFAQASARGSASRTHLHQHGHPHPHPAPNRHVRTEQA
jgi:hypothetical protein